MAFPGHRDDHDVTPGGSGGVVRPGDSQTGRVQLRGDIPRAIGRTRAQHNLVAGDREPATETTALRAGAAENRDRQQRDIRQIVR